MIHCIFDKNNFLIFMLTEEIDPGDKVSFILLLKEFPYVFIEYATSLLLERKVNFTIDLVP